MAAPEANNGPAGIVTGAGVHADQLAQMIEHENQRLRAKNQ